MTKEDRKQLDGEKYKVEKYCQNVDLSTSDIDN